MTDNIQCIQFRANQQKCCVCGKSTETGLVLVNHEDNAQFPNIANNEASHLECYINLSVEKEIKKQIEKASSKQ